MSVHKSANTELEQAKRRLLGEGAKLYLAGLNALTEFQREVQATCRRVIEASLSNQAKALHVKMESLQVQEDAWTDPNGKLARVGVTLKSGQAPPMFYGLWWEDDTELSISVGVQIERNNLKTAAALEGAFKEIDGTAVGRTRRWVWVSEQLAMDMIPAFEEKLEEMVSRWIRLWEGVGGFEVFSKIASIGSE